MGKPKIGSDIIKKKGGIVSTKKDSEEYEKFIEEREKKKKKEAEDIEGKKITSKMPDEGIPSDEQLAEERAKEEEEKAKAKARGLLKNVHVKEHHRSEPKKKEEPEP